MRKAAAVIGLGTVIDVALLIAGGLAGLLGRRFITPRVQDAVLKASALCVLFIGLAGTLEKMLEVTNDGLASGGAGMIIVSFTVGTLIGEFLNLELRMEHLGEWLRDRFAGDSENGFVDAFVTRPSPYALAPWPSWDPSRTVSLAITPHSLSKAHSTSSWFVP